MFKTYDAQLKKLLSSNASDTDWQNILGNHKEMIAKIQHERLIHLLVTIFVGTIMSIASFIIMITKTTGLLIFDIPLLILFVAYLFHYRYLENTTQNWYILEDKIKTNI